MTAVHRTGWVTHNSSISACLCRIVISPAIPQDSPPCYDSLMRNLAVLFIHFSRPGSVARSWRGPFPRCGVASAQAPDPDLESLPETISEFTRVGPGPRWLDGALGASNSSAPFRNRSEAFDTAWRSQSLEQAKVPDAVLPGSPPSARPERSERRTHPCGSRNEAT